MMRGALLAAYTFTALCAAFVLSIALRDGGDGAAQLVLIYVICWWRIGDIARWDGGHKA